MRRVDKHGAGGARRWPTCLLMTLLGTLPVTAAPPLRYHLAVGDQLVYERRVRVVSLEDESVLKRYTEQLQLWCLAGDSSDFLVLGNLVRVVDRRAGPTRGVLFHVGPRGQRRFPNEILTRIAGLDPLFDLIPILPLALETGPSWLTQPDHFGRRWRCTRVAADASVDKLARVDFVLEDPTGVAETRGVTQRGSYWFDPQAGVVARVESELRDPGAKRRALVVTRLHARLKREPLWCARRVAEANRFLCTLRLEDRLLDQIASDPDQIEQILARIERLWSELVLETAREPQSPLRRLAQARGARLRADKRRYRERAQLARQWLGKSAAHWSLQALDGETIRSETMRDRIVVECFWSADSLWSLRSFNILRDIQKRLPAETLRVVCLNIDADVALARRAARLCGTGLTHVLAGPPAAGEPPRELPVFRVVDRDSTVLGVYFGWQPTLAERIASLRR